MYSALGIAALALSLLACGSKTNLGADSGADANTPSSDGSVDASLAAFGEVSGDCNLLDDELSALTPAYLTSHFSFPSIYTTANEPSLAVGTRTLLNTPNEGGSSLYSEAFTFEFLARCEQAVLTATETQIEYEAGSAKTDFAVTIDGAPIGVSVTRAFKFPLGSPFTPTDAAPLIEGKLADIVESTANVKPAYAWDKQILGVMANDVDSADSVAAAYAAIASDIKADTILWVIITDGADEFIYCDGPCS